MRHGIAYWMTGAFACCGVLVSLWSCGGNRSERHRAFSGRVITVSERLLQGDVTDTLRFGRLHAGETARLETGIRNAGSDPIVLVREETTCGCTRLEYDARPILPGDTLRMVVLFDTSGQRGWQFKVVRLYFSSGARPLRLYIDAEVE